MLEEQPKPKKGKSKPQRPSRDEFELEELGNQLVEAKNENTELLLTVWKREERVRGWIKDMDAQTRMIHVTKYGDVMKIPFLNILKVERADRD